MNTVPLAEVCEILIGRTPSRSEPRYWNGELPWLSIADMNQGRSLRYTKERVTSVAQEECKLRVIEPGTVVMSFKLSIGRVGIAETRMATNEAIASLRVKNHSQLDPAYLSRVLESMDHAGGANRAAMGNTLNKASLAAIKIPVPPLDEQRRIAAILDKTDELRIKRRKALAHLDTLTQSIFHSMFGDPAPSATAFPVVRLADACHKITDGTHHSPSILDSGVPYITAKHLRPSGLDFFGNPWFISHQDHEDIYRRCDPKRGDVLYIKDGATTGVAAVNPYDFEFSMLSSLALIRPTAELTANYLTAWLNNPRVRAHLIRGVAGAAITRFTLSKIKEFKLPLPPLELQHTFATRVAAVERLTEIHRKHLAELDALFASLQHRAFRGEL